MSSLATEAGTPKIPDRKKEMATLMTRARLIISQLEKMNEHGGCYLEEDKQTLLQLKAEIDARLLAACELAIPTPASTKSWAKEDEYIFIMRQFVTKLKDSDAQGDKVAFYLTKDMRWTDTPLVLENRAREINAMIKKIEDAMNGKNDLGFWRKSGWVKTGAWSKVNIDEFRKNPYYYKFGSIYDQDVWNRLKSYMSQVSVAPHTLWEHIRGFGAIWIMQLCVYAHRNGGDGEYYEWIPKPKSHVRDAISKFIEQMQVHKKFEENMLCNKNRMRNITEEYIFKIKFSDLVGNIKGLIGVEGQAGTQSGSRGIQFSYGSQNPNNHKIYIGDRERLTGDDFSLLKGDWAWVGAKGAGGGYYFQYKVIQSIDFTDDNDKNRWLPQAQEALTGGGSKPMDTDELTKEINKLRF